MNKFPERFILTVNCGSSSIKFSLFHYSSMRVEVIGSVVGIGTSKPQLKISNNLKEILETKELLNPNFTEIVKEISKWLKQNEIIYPLVAIGFRIVLGGPDRYQAEAITDDLLKDLDQFVYLAPNHLPNELSAIQIFTETFPEVQKIACYDTSFHHDMPSHSKYYPLPDIYRNQGLIRYGFHGLSYESIMKKLSQRRIATKDKKIIIAHLGNGASMAAIKNNKSIDTSMGISPLGGLVMGTRPGDLDPGVMLFLLKHSKLSTIELDELLNKESGLKAIAGTSDMQTLVKEKNDIHQAKEAITIFSYHVKKFIGAYAAALGGLDLLIFTGGIGENSPVIRERICADMEFLGIELDKNKNTTKQDVISSENSKVMIYFLKTNEELIIAEHTCALINTIT